MPVAGKEGRLEVMGATFSPAKWGRQGGAQILGSKARPESLSNLVFRCYTYKILSPEFCFFYCFPVLLFKPTILKVESGDKIGLLNSLHLNLNVWGWN